MNTAPGPITFPGFDAAPEEQAQFRQQFGIPTDKTQYKVEALVHDKASQEFAQDLFNKAMLRPEQADLIANEFEKRRQAETKVFFEGVQKQGIESQNKLIGEFGDMTQPLVQRGVAALRQMGSGALADRIMNDPAIGNDYDVLRVIAVLGKEFGESEMVKAGTASFDGAASIPDIQRKINELCVAGGPYWDQKNPDHKRTKETVRTLYEQIEKMQPQE